MTFSQAITYFSGETKFCTRYTKEVNEVVVDGKGIKANGTIKTAFSF